MQNLATEMNLSETAFLVKQTDGAAEAYSLRWFTPACEVDLCGHATLASAHVLWSEGYLTTEMAKFHTRSGILTARRQDDWIELDFPAIATQSIAVPADLSKALGIEVEKVYESSIGLLIELDSPETVANLQPDFGLLKAIPCHGIIATSRVTSRDSFSGTDSQPYDFVSRYFAPRFGIDEDPVTGSAHCVLATYWADRLQKNTFLAYQSSARGGILQVQLEGDRVLLRGQAVTVLRGEVLVYG